MNHFIGKYHPPLPHASQRRRWVLAGVGFLWAAALTWQVTLGTLWQDEVPLKRLTDRSEEAGVFWASLPAENKAFLPVSRAGSLKAPAGHEWAWQWRGACDLVQAPGEYAFTPGTVWLRIPAEANWADSLLHLPRAVSGPWLVAAWAVFLGALWWASPRMRRFCGDNPPRSWQTVLVFLAGAFLFSIWRRPDWLLAPQLVNEDVWVFAHDAWFKGLASVWHPYAGYWHLLPRLGAVAVRDVPPEGWPMAYAVIAWLLTAGLGLLVAFSRLCPDWRGRLVMGWALYWVPNGGEVYFHLYNIQWIVLGVLFLMVIQPPALRWSQRWWEAAVVGVLGLTTPGVILMLPLLVARWAIAARWPELWPRARPGSRVRWFEEMPLVLAGGLAAGVQLLSVLGGTGADRGSDVLQPLLVLFLNFIHTALPGLFPIHWWGLGKWFGLMAWTLWLAGVIILWWKAPRETKVATILLLGGGGAILALGFLRPAGGTAIDLSSFSPLGTGSRYYFFLGLSVIWGLVLVVYSQPKIRERRWGVVLLIPLVLAQSTQLRVPPHIDFEWPAQAEKLRQLHIENQAGSSMPLQFPYGMSWKWSIPAPGERP